MKSMPMLRHTKARGTTRVLLAIALAWLVAACASPIGVTRWSMEDAYQQSYANALSADRPTSFTVQVLLRFGLYDRFADDPDGALAELHRGLAASDDYDRLFALSELSMLHGLAEDSRPHYLVAALYAHGFLVRDLSDAQPVPLDPRNRIAGDIYNAALARGLTVRTERAGPDGERIVEVVVALQSGRHELPFGELIIEAPDEFTWAGRTLEKFLPASEFNVYGLRNRYRQPGIGLPLIASLGPPTPGSEAGSALVPDTLKVPVTALLHVPDLRRGLANGHLSGTLHVFDMDSGRTVRISGYDVPLEFEPTSALAYSLQNAPVWDQEIRGFLGLSAQIFRGEHAHLITITPYRSGRIPVVLVHGTASSPLRWAELFNEMYADPDIRDQFQFWVFTYNTGNPIAFSAGLLRESLTRAVESFDPQGKDPALRRMVIIGHSQGGLLARLTAIDSGTRFWDNLSKKPLDELDLKPETKLAVRRSLFYTPLPFVKQLIFIATPHRGSYVAGSRVAQWLAGLVSLPGSVLSATTDLGRALAEDEPAKAALLRHIPRSVDNMTPGHPFIQTLASIPIDPAVEYHSIIAVSGKKPLIEDSDGVVAYTSAHLDGAASEKVIRSGHSVQSNPEAIEEVRRILREYASRDQEARRSVRGQAENRETPGHMMRR